jgi:hypothetical protein
MFVATSIKMAIAEFVPAENSMAIHRFAPIKLNIRTSLGRTVS